jgi:sugar (pentulose or hexulose) kinase
MGNRATVVLDIGKTWSKAGLWQSDGSPIAKRRRLNERLEMGGYLALDAESIETWLADTLREFGELADVGQIIPVSHGAGAALVRGGILALPPMDYEHPIPGAIRRDYETKRDPFAVTGSPALPDGLNLGAQLYYLHSLHPRAFEAGTSIMPWAQYWSWLLCGVACSEVTSLGCHTDLWCPTRRTYSELAVARGWADLMAPVRRAGEALGPLTPEWQRRTGLTATTTIFCGLHDSNAALIAARGFPQIADQDATVLSTGTWFVAMRTPKTPVAISAIPEDRDCLVIVDAFQQMIPSARFMGGREIELLTGIDARRIDIKPDQPELLAALTPVVESLSMMLPTLAPGTGPFPHGRGHWLSMPEDTMQRRAAVCLYAALLADTSLSLIGSHGCLLVEGRFAESDAFVRTLATLRPGTSVYSANAHSDVSYGALRLLDPTLRPPGTLGAVERIQVDLEPFRTRWRSEAERMERAA